MVGTLTEEILKCQNPRVLPREGDPGDSNGILHKFQISTIKAPLIVETLPYIHFAIIFLYIIITTFIFPSCQIMTFGLVILSILHCHVNALLFMSCKLLLSYSTRHL